MASLNYIEKQIQSLDKHICDFYEITGRKGWEKDRRRWDYEQITEANGKVKNAEGNYPEGVGSCPACGNPHTRGGHISAKDLRKEK